MTFRERFTLYNSRPSRALSENGIELTRPSDEAVSQKILKGLNSLRADSVGEIGVGKVYEVSEALVVVPFKFNGYEIDIVGDNKDNVSQTRREISDITGFHLLTCESPTK